MLVSKEWRGQGRNELPAGEYERENCLKKPWKLLHDIKEEKILLLALWCSVKWAVNELLWLGSCTPNDVYSADSNTVGLLKIAQTANIHIAPPQKNIWDQDVEEMMKSLCNFLLFFPLHNLLPAKASITAWWRFWSWHTISVSFSPSLYLFPSCISHCSFSFGVLHDGVHFSLSLPHGVSCFPFPVCCFRNVFQFAFW